MCKWSIFQALSPAFLFLYSLRQKPCVPWEQELTTVGALDNQQHWSLLCTQVPTFCSLLNLVILFHIHSSMNISYCQWMSYRMTSHKTHKCWEQARVYNVGLLTLDYFHYALECTHFVNDNFWKTHLDGSTHQYTHHTVCNPYIRSFSSMLEGQRHLSVADLEI